MLILISTNLREGKGLARDYEVLRVLLEGMGHRVMPAQFDAPVPAHHVELGIVLERCHPTFPDHCNKTWLIPNPEWWLPSWNGLLPCFERVLCKTRHGVQVFERIVGDRAEFIGWESPDRMVEKIPRQRRFLFNPGGSTARSHDAVLWVWERLGGSAPDLLVVGKHVQPRVIRGVEFQQRIDDEALQIEQNRCLFHLCPSAYEGWGHYIHEAESCKAMILTTDTEPMRGSVEAASWVNVGTPKPQWMVQTFVPDREGIELGVERMLQLRPSEIAEIGERARAAFLAERVAFRQRLEQIMAPYQGRK